MIERHWDGIAAYCRPENKVSLGFVEGLNRFASSSGVLTASKTRNTSASKSSPACCRNYSGAWADRSPDTLDHAVVLAAVKDASRRGSGGPKAGHP